MLPVQSIRMSPGSSIAIASSAVTTAAVRCTAFDTRASIRSLTARSMALSGQNPSVQSRRSAIRSGGNRLSEGEALVELRRIEDGLDAVAVDGVGAVALDRVRHEVRRELDHPGARVLVPLLVEAHGEPVHRLEQRREQKTDGPCADHVHSPAGRQGLQSCGIGCRGRHSPPRFSCTIGDAAR